jgi:hypothetical protein
MVVSHLPLEHGVKIGQVKSLEIWTDTFSSPVLLLFTCCEQNTFSVLSCSVSFPKTNKKNSEL